MMRPPPPEEEAPAVLEDGPPALHCPNAAQLAWRFCDQYLVAIGVEDHRLACACPDGSECPLLTAGLG